jgi:hypothetical protein
MKHQFCLGKYPLLSASLIYKVFCYTLIDLNWKMFKKQPPLNKMFAIDILANLLS